MARRAPYWMPYHDYKATVLLPRRTIFGGYRDFSFTQGELHEIQNSFNRTGFFR